MNPSQIAEETEKALEYYHDKKQRVFIIQAAIEKATKECDEKWRERFRQFEKIEEKFGPAVQRAAHASELVRKITETDKTGDVSVHYEPARASEPLFNTAYHHLSCTRHDQDLVWKCAQCGHTEPAQP